MLIKWSVVRHWKTKRCKLLDDQIFKYWELLPMAFTQRQPVSNYGPAPNIVDESMTVQTLQVLCVAQLLYTKQTSLDSDKRYMSTVKKTELSSVRAFFCSRPFV